MGEVAFRPTFYQINRGVIDEMAPRYFSIINRDRYFVFMTATSENPVSHTCVVTKGRKPLLICVINLHSCFSQAVKTEEVCLYQTCLPKDRHRICL
jgi:hypothetical protein